MIGDKSTANIAIDNNEIMARNNNGTNPLHLQTNGGDLYIHNNCPEEDNNKIVFRDDGNVGIGTISPEAKLHLVGGSDVNLSGGGFLVIGDKSTANIAIDNNEIMARNNNGTNPLHLQTNGGDLYIHNNCPEEDKNKIVFRDDGNVGIGTTEPMDKLDVHGALLFNGNDKMKVSGELRNGMNAVVIRGNWDELEIKGRVIDWTGSNLQIGYDNDHSGDHIEIGRKVGHIRFLSGGGDSETMRITDGKVGIGTTEPTHKFHVKTTSAVGLFESTNNNAYLRLYTSEGEDNRVEFCNRSGGRAAIWVAGGGDTFNVLRDGKVGIGTSNPSSKLHIKSGVTTSLTLTGAGKSYTNAEIVLEATDDDENYRGLGIFMHDKEGKTEWYAGTPYAYADQYQIGRASGINSHSRATAITSNAFLTIKDNGNVGIGTTDPGAKLHIDGGLKMNIGEGLEFLGENNYFGNNLDARIFRMIDTNGLKGLVDGGIAIEGYTPKEPDEAKKRKLIMVIRGNGNVGIGTLEPNHKLEVAGYIYAENEGIMGNDYAEYFESKNGKDIPAGTSVVLDNGKIRRAKKNETPIGIISANPGMAGGVHVEWPKKYLRDEFGMQIMEEYKEEIMASKKEKIKKERQKIKKKKIKEKITRTEIACEDGKYFQKEITETIEREVEEPVFKEVDLYDDKKEKIIGKHRIPVMETYEEEIDVLADNGQPVMVGTGKFETKNRPKINPDYDETKEYIPREKRPEWNCVGLLGQLPLRKGQPTADTWVKIKDISKDVELWLVK